MAAVDDVAWERRRQIEEEGYDAAHDDARQAGVLAIAGMCYAAQAIGKEVRIGQRPPWTIHMRTPRDGLVKAAALICAEIDRLDRAVGRA